MKDSQNFSPGISSREARWTAMDLLPIWRRRWEVQRRRSGGRPGPVSHHVEREAERERKGRRGWGRGWGRKGRVPQARHPQGKPSPCPSPPREAERERQKMRTEAAARQIVSVCCDLGLLGRDKWADYALEYILRVICRGGSKDQLPLQMHLQGQFLIQPPL